MSSDQAKGVISKLFTLSGSPYRGNVRMTGRPLRAEELFLVLDLDRPGLEALEAEEAWYSPKWFEKEPLPAFRYRHQLRQAPARFVTVLMPYEGRQAPAVAVALDQAPIGAQTLRLHVVVSGVEHRLERDLPGDRLDSRRSSRRDGQGGK